MGLLVDGVWREKPPAAESKDGRFMRQPTKFRNWITRDGSAGPTGESGFKAETGRYHLYVSLACPWAHRTLIFRKLKKLEDIVSLSIVAPINVEHGWEFSPYPGMVPDSANHKNRLADIYLLADPKFTGRVTVPVLWDKQRGTIVNNESSEIIRIFNGAFNALTGDTTDYFPAALRDDIERMNKPIYETVNNGVYRAGFATTQDAYEEACLALFKTLDETDALLSKQRYLAGKQITEADWRLFVTLVRFDAVYYSHFKCNVRRIADYPNLSNYLRELYQVPGIASTVSFEHIKKHYYGAQLQVNPTGIVPLGPTLDFTAPHDRARFAAAAT